MVVGSLHKSLQVAKVWYFWPKVGNLVVQGLKCPLVCLCGVTCHNLRISKVSPWWYQLGCITVQDIYSVHNAAMFEKPVLLKSYLLHWDSFASGDVNREKNSLATMYFIYWYEGQGKSPKCHPLLRPVCYICRMAVCNCPMEHPSTIHLRWTWHWDIVHSATMRAQGQVVAGAELILCCVVITRMSALCNHLKGPPQGRRTNRNQYLLKFNPRFILDSGSVSVCIQHDIP